MRKRSDKWVKYNYIFNSINTETEAYMLGLLYADGCVSYKEGRTRNYQVLLHLQKQDKELLDKLNSYISNETTVVESKSTFYLRFSSKEMCGNLIKLGCLSNKTYKTLSLPFINPELIRHFIRGYFDGDGTVYIDRKWLRTNICSVSLSFLEEIKVILENTGIQCRINTEKRKNKSFRTPQNTYSTNCMDMHRLFVTKGKEIDKFFQYMYQDSTIFLTRKHNKFIDYANREVNDGYKKTSSPQSIDTEPKKLEYNVSTSTQLPTFYGGR